MSTEKVPVERRAVMNLKEIAFAGMKRFAPERFYLDYGKNYLWRGDAQLRDLFPFYQSGAVDYRLPAEAGMFENWTLRMMLEFCFDKRAVSTIVMASWNRWEFWNNTWEAAGGWLPDCDKMEIAFDHDTVMERVMERPWVNVFERGPHYNGAPRFEREEALEICRKAGERVGTKFHPSLLDPLTAFKMLEGGLLLIETEGVYNKVPDRLVVNPTWLGRLKRRGAA
jgi:hypothetical protein